MFYIDGVASFTPRTGQLVAELGATRDLPATFSGNPTGKIFLVPEGRKFFEWFNSIQNQGVVGVVRLFL
jgi:hypothetical protein